MLGNTIKSEITASYFEKVNTKKKAFFFNAKSKQNAKPRRLLSIQAKQYVKSDSAVYKNYELENSLKNGRAEKYMVCVKYANEFGLINTLHVYL